MEDENKTTPVQEETAATTETSETTESPEKETIPNNTGTEEKVVINIKSSDYTSVMDALFGLNHGDQKMARYAPLMFLTTMSYADSKEWVRVALNEYKEKFYQEGEPRSWPIQKCLKVYQARKEKKEKRRLGQPV